MFYVFSFKLWSQTFFQKSIFCILLISIHSVLLVLQSHYWWTKIATCFTFKIIKYFMNLIQKMIEHWQHNFFLKFQCLIFKCNTLNTDFFFFFQKSNILSEMFEKKNYWKFSTSHCEIRYFLSLVHISTCLHQ